MPSERNGRGSRRPPSGRETTSREARLTVEVRPRAARNQIVEVGDTALRVGVTAPPLDGAANAAVRDLLAATLGCPRSAVAIVRGERSRTKVVRVLGLTPAECRARFASGAQRPAP